MSDQLMESIQNLCVEYGVTLALAESCTGGHLAARITRLPGCSQYFLGSIVAYSNAVKMKMLGVRDATLIKYGAVSEPVVKQMATGVKELLGSECSIAVSGIAGPTGGTPDKPVGTVWAAIIINEAEPFIIKLNLSGSRVENMESCVEILLTHFKERLDLLHN